MRQAETEKVLRWLMTLRVAIVTTLLLSAFAIELLFRPAETLQPLFVLAAVAYGAALGYALADRWLAGTRTFAFLQLGGDVILVTLFVRITGGMDSPMSFLYLLPIAVAALLLYRGGAFGIAALSYGCYAALVVQGGAWLPLGLEPPVVIHREPGRVLYFLLVHLVAMIAVALLASALAERLRSQGRELDERRGAVARLQALNENIIESINSGLVTTDLEGRVNFINRGGLEITGWRHDDAVRRTVESLFGLEQGFLDQARQRLLAERRFRFERWVTSGDQREIFVGIAVSNLVDKGGQPLGYIFIFQDLTEIHALEREVRLKERMAALGEMAAGMAHELRNPLAAISGSVQYLKGGLRPTGETLELMDIILRESHRLDQTIRDFLTFARPGDFSPERVDLVRLVEEHVKLLRRSLQIGPRHRIVTRHAAARMVTDVDPNRLKQVFWNLSTNALKAMPDGGELMIGLDWRDGGEAIELTFADEGLGMDESEVERYFQPFSSSFDEGTGLGAAIVYRLVQEHGGRVQLDSRRGCGTTVRILLPLQQTGQEAAPLLAAAGG